MFRIRNCLGFFFFIYHSETTIFNVYKQSNRICFKGKQWRWSCLRIAENQIRLYAFIEIYWNIKRVLISMSRKLNKQYTRGLLRFWAIKLYKIRLNSIEQSSNNRCFERKTRKTRLSFKQAIIIYSGSCSVLWCYAPHNVRLKYRFGFQNNRTITRKNRSTISIEFCVKRRSDKRAW